MKCRCPVCGKFVTGFDDYTRKGNIKVVCTHQKIPGDTHFIYIGPRDIAEKMGFIVRGIK